MILVVGVESRGMEGWGFDVEMKASLYLLPCVPLHMPLCAMRYAYQTELGGVYIDVIVK